MWKGGRPAANASASDRVRRTASGGVFGGPGGPKSRVVPSNGPGRALRGSYAAPAPRLAPWHNTNCRTPAGPGLSTAHGPVKRPGPSMGPPPAGARSPAAEAPPARPSPGIGQPRLPPLTLMALFAQRPPPLPRSEWRDIVPRDACAPTHILCFGPSLRNTYAPLATDLRVRSESPKGGLLCPTIRSPRTCRRSLRISGGCLTRSTLGVASQVWQTWARDLLKGGNPHDCEAHLSHDSRNPSTDQIG